MTWLHTAKVPDPCMLKPAHIPEYSKPVTLRHITNSTVKRVVVKYLQNIDVAAAQGIAPAILGKGGEFKTLGACIIARQIFERAEVQVEFVQCPVVFPRLERLRYEKATNKQLEYMAKVPFLVMDDFTQVRAATWAADFLVEIAEARYGAKLPTLWTGNAVITKTDWSSLENMYGQAFTRRLVEGSRGYTIVLKTG